MIPIPLQGKIVPGAGGLPPFSPREVCEVAIGVPVFFFFQGRERWLNFPPCPFPDRFSGLTRSQAMGLARQMVGHRQQPAIFGGLPLRKLLEFFLFRRFNHPPPSFFRRLVFLCLSTAFKCE